jgi:hypothetical protein
MALVCQAAAEIEVVIFLAVDCPILNRLTPELRRLASVFQPKGVRFRAVFPSSQLTAERLGRWSRDYNPGFPVERDPEQNEAQRAGATHTPEAAVFAAGKLVYRGRIDDRNLSWGRTRPKPTKRDLQAAIEAVLSGRAVPQPWPSAVGCFIER